MVEQEHWHKLAVGGGGIEARHAVIGGVVAGGDLLDFNALALFGGNAVLVGAGGGGGGGVGEPYDVCVEIVGGAGIFGEEAVNFLRKVDVERAAALQVVNGDAVQRVNLLQKNHVRTGEAQPFDEHVGVVGNDELPVLGLRNVLERRAEHFEICGAVGVGVDVEGGTGVIEVKDDAAGRRVQEHCEHRGLEL